MSGPIGFSNCFPKDWEESGQLKFERHKDLTKFDHTKTLRYLCKLEKRVFDWYAPKFVIFPLTGNKNPDEIIVKIFQSDHSNRTIGFQSKPIQRQASVEFLPYDFNTEKPQPVNSVRYRMSQEQDEYGL